MSVSLKTAPVLEPFTVSEVKSFLRISHSTEDILLTSMIVAARQIVEEYTLRALITQTWEMWLDAFPGGRSTVWWDGTLESHANILNAGMKNFLVLPRPPLVSITHLKTYDDSDTATTFSSSYYIADTKGTPGRLGLKTGASWPVALRGINAVNVEWVAGYGVASAVPTVIKQAIYTIISDLYENRGDDQKMETYDIPSLAKRLLQPYRVLSMGGDSNA